VLQSLVSFNAQFTPMYENVLENRRRWQHVQSSQAAVDETDDHSSDQCVDQSSDQSVIDQCVDQPVDQSAAADNSELRQLKAAGEDSKLTAPSASVNN